MKTATIFAALLAVVAAAPLEKRRIYWVTTTTEVIEYISVTTTVYVDSLPTTSAQGGAFYNVPQGQPAIQTSSVPIQVSSPQTPSSAPAPPPVVAAPSSAAPPAAPSSVYVAPPAPPPSVAPAPPAPSVYVAPAPAPAPARSAAPAPPAPAPSAPVAAQAAASGPSGTTYSGDITYYDVGMGSCGRVNTPDQAVVALAIPMMNNPPNPNNNPLCGKTITISYGGSTHTATVVDTCYNCSPESIDLSTSLFKQVAPGGDGRVHNVQWWFN